MCLFGKSLFNKRPFKMSLAKFQLQSKAQPLHPISAGFNLINQYFGLMITEQVSEIHHHLWGVPGTFLLMILSLADNNDFDQTLNGNGSAILISTLILGSVLMPTLIFLLVLIFKRR